MSCHSRQVHSPVPSSMKNKTYSVFRNTVSTVRKSRQDPRAEREGTATRSDRTAAAQDPTLGGERACGSWWRRPGSELGELALDPHAAPPPALGRAAG